MHGWPSISFLSNFLIIAHPERIEMFTARRHNISAYFFYQCQIENIVFKSILLLFSPHDPHENIGIALYFRSLHINETSSEKTRRTIDYERGTIACKHR